MSAPTRPVCPLPALCALLALACAACSTAPPERTALMRQAPRVTASAAELRLKMRAFAHRFVQIVEGAAEDIVLGSEDLELRLGAVAWKIRATALAETSCYLADPLAALIDTWALAVQQRDYFERGNAERLFGERAPIALAAARHIEAEIEDLVRSVMDDVALAEGRDYVQDWAAAHPIPRTWSTRDSMLPELAAFLQSESLGTLAQVGQLGEDLGDIAMRLSLYNEVLPNQARWQAEALLLESGVIALVQEARAALPALAEAVARSTAFMDGVEVMIDERVTAVADQIAQEREAVLAYAEQARLETLAALELERVTILEALTAERLATLEAARAELQLMMEQLVEERQAAIADLKAMVAEQWPNIREDLPGVGARSVHESRGELVAFADRLLLRLAALGAAGLVLAFLGGLALLHVARRGAARAAAHQV